MKKTILVASLMVILATGPAMAQMMGGGPMMGSQANQQMMEQQQVEQNAPAERQNYNQYMGPGMMGGYGYGMGPGMMGYGMGPGMMGYGMGPGMMGGYGYGMGQHMMGTENHPCMSGGYGYGMMGPGMMGNHGYGMGPGMMGYYSPEQYEKQFKENQKFFDDTRELRKKLHNLRFDFAEAQRNPDTKPEDLKRMNAEMEGIWKLIHEKK